MDTSIDINKYVGNKIREYRKKKNISQGEVGKLLGVSQNTVSGYENGTIELGNVNLFKLSQYFGIKADVLFPPTQHIGSEDVIERAMDHSKKDFSLEELNFLKKLAEKTLSMDEQEREKFLESIKFTVDYYDNMKN